MTAFEFQPIKFQLNNEQCEALDFTEFQSLVFNAGDATLSAPVDEPRRFLLLEFSGPDTPDALSMLGEDYAGFAWTTGDHYRAVVMLSHDANPDECLAHSKAVQKEIGRYLTVTFNECASLPTPTQDMAVHPLNGQPIAASGVVITVSALDLKKIDRRAMAAFIDKLKDHDLWTLQRGNFPLGAEQTERGHDVALARILHRHSAKPEWIADMVSANNQHGLEARHGDIKYLNEIVREACHTPKAGGSDLPNWQNLTREAGKTTDDDMHKVDPPWPHVAGPSRPMGNLTILAGPGGVGKSTEALHQGLCIAAGLKYRGVDTIKGISVFVSCEDSRLIIKARMQAWLGRIPEDIRPQVKADLKENFFFFGNDEVGGMQVTIKEFTQCAPSREAVEMLVKISEGAVSLLVETIAMVNGGDEMNADLMQVALALKEVARRTGANVQGIHHVTKESVAKYPPTLQSMRGGGSLGDAARGVVVMVELPDNQYSKLHITKIHEAPVFAVWNVKASYLPTHPPFYLRRLPGPVYEQVEGASEAKGEEAAQSRLLQYMRKPEHAEGLSLRQLQEGCTKMMIDKRDIRGVLDSLDGKEVKAVSSKTKGKRGVEHSIWVLNEKESRAQLKSELLG